MTGLVAITGSHGLVGRRLLDSFAADGIQPLRLVRSTATTPGSIHWDPKTGADPVALQGTHAVVHLAGEPLMGRWTTRKKEAILQSRVEGTRNLCETLADMEHPPEVLVSGSAVGYYGDRGEEPLTENSSPGSGYLADVCAKWEEATAPARLAGIRVVHLRTSIVLDAAGGALGQMLPFFRAGIGGRLGNGQQWMPWISGDDMARVIRHAINSKIEGPINAVAHSDRNADFTKALGAALHRPTIFPLPAFAARLVFGELADALLLSGQHVQAARLEADGFQFQHQKLADALPDVLQPTPKSSA